MFPVLAERLNSPGLGRLEILCLAASYALPFVAILFGFVGSQRFESRTKLTLGVLLAYSVNCGAMTGVILFAARGLLSDQQALILMLPPGLTLLSPWVALTHSCLWMMGAHFSIKFMMEMLQPENALDDAGLPKLRLVVFAILAGWGGTGLSLLFIWFSLLLNEMNG